MITGYEANLELRNEFLGFYRAMDGNHTQFAVLYDHIIDKYALESFDALAIPTLFYFNESRIAILCNYIEEGGSVV